MNDSISNSLQGENYRRARILLTAFVTISIFGLLLWGHFHGGVPSHHILAQKDLPEISNWWGGLLLPVLTWFLLGRLETRLNRQNSLIETATSQNPRVLGLFILGLSLGLGIAISFTYDYKLFLDNILYILLILSVIVPIYYPEFILGFILGMTYTFGAILPTVFILIIAAIGFLVYKFIRLLISGIKKVLGK